MVKILIIFLSLASNWAFCQVRCSQLASNIDNVGYKVEISGPQFLNEARGLIDEYKNCAQQVSIKNPASVGAFYRQRAEINNRIIDTLNRYFQPTPTDLSTKQSVEIFGKVYHYKGTAGGLRNQGVYLSEDGTDFIKVLKANPVSVLNEVHWLSQADSFDGPKLYSLGKTEKGDFFIHMENRFPEQEAYSIKDISYKKKAFPESFASNVNDKYNATLVEDIAQNYFNIIKNNILPFDIDFLINKDGHAKWIDVGLWTKADSKAEIIKVINDFHRRASYLLPDLYEPVMRKLFSLMENNPQISVEEFNQMKQTYDSCPCMISKRIMDLVTNMFSR